RVSHRAGLPDRSSAVVPAARCGLRASRVVVVCAWAGEILQRVLLVTEQQAGQDGEEPGEDEPGEQDGEAAGLGHFSPLLAGRSWPRRAETSIRGRLTAVTWDQGTASE